jgi:hypothetical protein
MTTKESHMNAKEVRRRNAKVPRCIGRLEVAMMLGTKPGNLDKIAHLPEPVPWSTELSRGKLWREDVIEAFVAERHERQAGKAPV